jgi:hypothetical protein
MTNTKVIFQIAYDQESMFTRAALLERRRHHVVSVLDTKVAKDVLVPGQHYDLFIIGHSAPESERLDIVNWLRGRYPGAKILALNLPHRAGVPGADFNVGATEIADWLTVIDGLQ